MIADMTKTATIHQGNLMRIHGFRSSFRNSQVLPDAENMISFYLVQKDSHDHSIEKIAL